ncbi:MAG: hypothetical protein ACLVIF_09950 [Phocaeicola coprocola]|uniref:hypothetical protein n=1 Tax=Phocaeicola coprocola TaxID=310298 RepID=UPI00399B6ACA
MKKLKNHSIKVRMTEEEMAYHLKQAASYTSMSHYVRSALKEYSHPDLKLQHELIPQIGEFYQKVHNELSWAGGNLNQAMKRANELAAVHLLSPSYVLEVLIPVILETKEAINQIQKRLDVLARMVTKP